MTALCLKWILYIMYNVGVQIYIQLKVAQNGL